MFKKAALFTILVWLGVVLQVAFFSGWVFAGVSPQILPVFGYFVFIYLKEDLLWWFLLLYFIFYGLITGLGHPGFYLLAAVAFFSLLYFLNRRYVRFLGVSSLIYFVFISVFFGWLILGQRDPRFWLSGILVNFVFFLVLYPFFLVLKHWSEPSSGDQLSLKI